MTSPAVDQRELESIGDSDKHFDPSTEFWLVLAGLTMVYAAAALLESVRWVWFDELFTFDIARSPSLNQLWRVLRFDNNPPLSYLLSRFSMEVLGPTPFALRLPSMVEFYLGSVAIFLYLRRKVGTAASGLGVLILWGSTFFYYATEARPYALVIMCFAFLLLSWDKAVREERRRVAIFGVASSTSVLLAAHVFAPLSWFPFLVAEAVRFWRRRRPDYALWAALLLPAIVMALYIPLIRAYSGIIIPPSNRASWRLLGEFFSASVFPLFHFTRTMGLAILALMLLPAAKRKYAVLKPSPEEMVIFSLLLLNPILLTVIQMRRHGGFFDRYCITTAVAIYLAIAILLAIRLRPGRVAVGAAALVMISLIAMNVLRTRRVLRADAIPWASLRPELPIVDASGMTFFEMNHHANPQLLSRLYYLKDRDASLRYDSTNYFQDFAAPDDMKKAEFPITANIEPYSRFIHLHHEFLVFGNPDEWVWRKLKDDGATETLIADYSGLSPYANHSQVYLVTMGQSVSLPSLLR